MTIQEIKNRFGIIGSSPALDRAIDVAQQVAPTNLSVLITGEKNGAYYITKVEDYGCGMADTSIKEIHALKQFAEEKYLEEGVGLGLALVQKIVNATGGYLRLHSKLNESTTVEIGLPIIKS